MTSRWGRTGFKTAGEVCKWHRDFDAGKIESAKTIRDWIADALDARTVVHEQYRKMAWDLDRDIVSAAGTFRVDPNDAYSPEEAHLDLQRVWRRLMLRYAFQEAGAIANRISGQEWSLWNNMSPEQRKLHGHPTGSRWWRWKDRMAWRLGVAVLCGYGLLASSSALLDTLKDLDARWQTLPLVPVAVVAGGLTLSFTLALVEVERRVGWRPWFRVLCRRAFSLTMRGVFWAGLGSPLIYGVGWALCHPPTLGRLALYAVSALLLGNIFQVFWQDRGIAEPLS